MITLFDASEEQSKKEVDGLTWAMNDASDKAAQAEAAVKDRDGVIRSLQESVAAGETRATAAEVRAIAAEVRAIKAEADLGDLQASVLAFRLRDANEAVDVGAYNILVGRLEILEAAEGGAVGDWKFDEVKAEMQKWYPEGAGVPGTRFVEFLEENKDEGNDDAGGEHTASTASGTA